MANKNRAKAQKMAARGASVKEIKKKTGFGGETTRKIISNWGPTTDPNANEDPVYKGGGSNEYDYNNQVLSDTGKYPFQWQFEHEIGLENIRSGATTQSATIRGEADKEVARAYADAQKYASQLGLEGTKYASDKESEWRQAVANIEVKGKLDLQPIINAGLERVAGIEAQASRDVAETTGKYGLASTKEQTAAQERLGKMQLAGSMYGLLGAAFG